jgi:hypothetical protein
MKKKGLILTILIIVLATLAMFAMNLVRNSGKSDTELLEFAIADTASIDKVIIHDAYANTFEIKREKGQKWTDKDGNCIVQEPVYTILETIKNIEFKGYVPKAAREDVKRRMAASSIKVEIFSNGKWAKTWYVGYSTQDHYGTHMLLETPSEKSDLPVIMKVRGLNGIIEPRFFADSRRWSCTEIFTLQKDDIREVEVKHYDVPERSFTIKNNGNTYEISNNGKPLENVDTSMIVRYLNNYRKIHYEFDNFELNDQQVDSLRKSQPFCSLKVTQKDGTISLLKLHHLKGDGFTKGNDFGDDVDYDVNRFWCFLPSGKLVKCQFFVFNPLINGRVYFGIEKLANPSE